jgi:hypothetical protein
VKRRLLLLAALIGLWMANDQPQPHAAPAAIHPRLWLTPALLSAVRAKAASGDRDWTSVKAEADRLVATRMPHFSVTAATNTNPVEFTLKESIPWRDSVPVFIGGGAGAWAGVNSTGGDRPNARPAKRSGEHTFTVPVDSTSFGPAAGQRFALFFSEGGFSNYGYQGSDWQSALQTLGLAYQVTGNTAYAAKGVELLDYIASLGVARMLAPIAIDSGFPSRSAVAGLALGYDWLYDRLTPSQRAVAVEALDVWYQWFKRAAFQNDGPAYGNYFGGHVMGFGMAGLATEFGNPRGHEIVTEIRRLFDARVSVAFGAGAFAGGYPVEVYTYGANHFQRLLSYMLAVKTATGEDLFGSTRYAQKMARSLLYNLKPNRWQVTDEGNYPGDYTAVLQPGLPLLLAHVLEGTPEGGWMQFLYQNLAAAPAGGRLDDPFSHLLFFQGNRTATDYTTTQPTWDYSPGDEHLVRRSSWRDDAVWASINGGSGNWSAGHQMRAAGHVSLQRGNDYLLVNSGQWKGGSGTTGTPAAFDVRSWRGNTLFVDDRGEYQFAGKDYLGGQGFWGTNSVRGVEGNSEFAYMSTDVTTAYTVGEHAPFEKRSVRYFHRNFLSMGGGVMIVFDRIGLSKNTHTANLYFHFNPAGGPPAVIGDTVTSRIGDSALFMKTLWPAVAKLQGAADPVSDEDARRITYRIEVSDPAHGTTFDALNAFVATSAAIRQAPSIERIESTEGHMIGAMVLDGRTSRVGLFSTDGVRQSSVTYTAGIEPGRVSYHVVADLVKGTSYDIALNGSKLSTVSASNQGVAFFQASGGGRFEIRRSRDR